MNGKDIFQEIYKEQVAQFKTTFINSSRSMYYDPEKKNNLHHAGEFGVYRERIVTKFLRLFTPQRLEFDDGFVIVPNDKPSKQLDIIIYDKNESPLIKSEEGQKFYPMETVASIGEIKSALSLTILKKELKNLVQMKKMRESLGDRFRLYSSTPKELDMVNGVTNDFPFTPSMYTHDQISTFLICEKFDFQINEGNANEKIGSLYKSDTLDRHKVDFILSLEDGFIGYYDEVSGFLMFPCTTDGYKIELVPSDKEDNHIKQFVNLFYNRLTITSIVKPEISEYFK